MFKKEKTIHEFAEDLSIKKLLDGGFLKIDESKYTSKARTTSN